MTKDEMVEFLTDVMAHTEMFVYEGRSDLATLGMIVGVIHNMCEKQIESFDELDELEEDCEGLSSEEEFDELD